MRFTILSWNIWLENQLNGRDRTDRLLQELRMIIDAHQPDCIGLNEVLKHAVQGSAPILDFLKEHGYVYQDFALASPFTDDWLIGAAIASRHGFSKLEQIETGDDVPAKQRGYYGHKVKAIAATLTLPDAGEVAVIVTHPVHLRPSTLKEHYRQTNSIAEYLHIHGHPPNTIVMGDFNEPRLMPKSFRRRMRHVLHHRTGSLARPTWSFNAWRFAPIRANLDRIFWTKSSTLQLADFRVLPVGASDHKPLLAVFELDPAKEV